MLKNKFTNITSQLPTNGSYEKRKLNTIDRIVIHHSAGAATATPEDFARWHIQDHNWPGIGYHYYIGTDGKIQQTNSLNTVSYHAGYEANLKGIAIVLPGNFNNEMPTDAQLKSMKNIIQILKLRFGKNLIVEGHKDEQNTSCPGTNLYNYLKQNYA